MASTTPVLDGSVSRDNAFGALRLFFAALVIVSHTPELVDGNFDREPLFMLFGTVTLGELAVDGFFIISGYLIVASFLKTRQIVPYLWRRVGRIYPGFIVATLFSLLIVAPLAGTTLATQFEWAGFSVLRVILLEQPYLPDVFTTNPITPLNGPMWTIAYEFRCYLLVIVLTACGLFRYPGLVAILAFVCLAASHFLPDWVFERVDYIFPYWTAVFGHLQPTLRLTGLFLAGSVFFLRPSLIPSGKAQIVLCVAGLIACMPFAALAELGIAVFGSMLIFAIAFGGKGRVINRINAKTDISYGVYLYAWPIEQLLIYYFPLLNLLELGVLTLVFAALAGWLSWQFIERHALAAAKKIEWPVFGQTQSA